MPTQALHFNKNNLLRKAYEVRQKSKKFNLKGRKTYKLLVKTHLKRKGKKVKRKKKPKAKTSKKTKGQKEKKPKAKAQKDQRSKR
jgi:hypothetical protein